MPRFSETYLACLLSVPAVMGVGWAFNRATTYSVAYQVSRHYLNQL